MSNGIGGMDTQVSGLDHIRLVTPLRIIWLDGPRYIRYTGKAQDIYGYESNWSEPHGITINENNPPSTPEITGPDRVKRV